MSTPLSQSSATVRSRATPQRSKSMGASQQAQQSQIVEKHSADGSETMSSAATNSYTTVVSGAEASKPSSAEGLGLTSTQISELHEIFALVDSDHSGKISQDELYKMMSILGFKASQYDMHKLMREIDSKNSGEIDLGHFVATMSKRVSKIQDPALILKAFKKFERPGSVRPGCIQIRDLLSALTNEGPRTKRLSKERANEVIRKIAPDSRVDDYFNYEDYVRTMLS